MPHFVGTEEIPLLQRDPWNTANREESEFPAIKRATEMIHATLVSLVLFRSGQVSPQDTARHRTRERRLKRTKRLGAEEPALRPLLVCTGSCAGCKRAQISGVSRISGSTIRSLGGHTIPSMSNVSIAKVTKARGVFHAVSTLMKFIYKSKPLSTRYKRRANASNPA